MKRASIDLGTNTCLLLIQEITPQGTQILHDESQIVRLGQGVSETRKLCVEAMERARKCLEQYTKKVQEFGILPSEILAVATAQARNAENAVSFFDSIQADLEIRFRILSGDEEAKATFLGAALPKLNPAQMVVLDIGGGSTELVAMPTDSVTIFGKSLDMGAVKLTEKFLKSDPVTDEEFWACEAAIDELLETMQGWRASLHQQLGSKITLVAVAGTAVTLAMLQESLMDYDRNQIDGVVLTQGDAHRLVEELKWRTIAERQAMPGMEAKRADVILAGALIFWRVMERLSFSTAVVSTRGLRYGVFDLGMSI